METFEEPIRIISDLHLAHPGSSVVDVAQLSPLLEGAKTVIFNGDTTEERLKEYRDLAAAQLEELGEMCAGAGAAMVMVRGNHDPTSPPHGSIDLCGGKVFVTHGDVLYPDVSPWSRNIQFARDARKRIERDYPPDYRDDLESALEVSRRVTLEMEVRQPQSKPGLIGKLKTMLSQAWPPSRPITILKVWFGAPRLTEQVLKKYRPGAKVFIVGHTHRPFYKRRDGRVLINTGAFLTMSKAYAVDIVGGRLSIRHIRERDGKFALDRSVGEITLD